MAGAMDSTCRSICLDLLKDPVTIPCGHSYCMGCIKDCLDQEDDKGIYSCPQCRQTFIPRPVLNRNTILAELVENLKKTRLQAAPPDHYYAGPGDVECDSCTGIKLKAVKSCLVCLLPLKSTSWSKPPNNYRRRSVLIMTNYWRFTVVLISSVSVVFVQWMNIKDMIQSQLQQKGLRNKWGRNIGNSRIYKREIEIEELRKAVDSLKRSAKSAVEDCERIFTELIRSFQRRGSKLKKLIRAQEKAEVSRAEGLLKQLEQEVAELRRRDVELKQLSHTEDDIHFLQSFQFLCVFPGSDVLPSINVNPHVSFEYVKKSVSQMKDQLQDVCKQEISNISLKELGCCRLPQVLGLKGVHISGVVETTDASTCERPLLISSSHEG